MRKNERLLPKELHTASAMKQDSVISFDYPPFLEEA
jgi:hypothetical protein